MRYIVLFPLFVSLTWALWPQPVTYKHGDTVLFLQKDVSFYWYEIGARKVGSIAVQQPFVFASNSNAGPDVQKDWRLRKQYRGPTLESEDYQETKEGVSGDDIIDHAIRSTHDTGRSRLHRKVLCSSLRLT
jgi:hexosaminidase